MRSRLAFGLLIACVSTCPLSAASIADYRGSWEGNVVYDDEPLILRMHVEERDGQLSVSVDFPQLVFARQPVEAGISAHSLDVTLPFGLGKHHFRPKDGRLVSRVDLGNKPVLVSMGPTEPFEASRTTLVFGSVEPHIEGTLVVPPGEGPFPLVLLTAGSGDPHRRNWSYASWADPLARRGLASLAYDRRPDRENKADGSRYDFADHARDLSAAIDALENHDRIDLDRVGILGKSRGAWIGLATAAADSRVRFLIGIGGAAVGVAAQDLQMIESRMRATGEPEEAIQHALAYMRVYFHVASNRQDWPRLARAASRAGGAPWAEYVRIPEKPEDLDWFSANLSFDPMSIIPDLELPLFYAWGTDDHITPPDMNRPLFEALLSDRSLARSRLAVYVGAGHTLEGPLNTDGDDETVWAGMNQQFLSDLWNWLDDLRLTEILAGGD